MLKKYVRKLVNMFVSPAAKNTKPKLLCEIGEDFYYQYEYAYNGYGGYHMVNVHLLKKTDPAFSRCILDQHGRIAHFPGVETGSWKKNLILPLDHTVRFAFSIGTFKDGKAPVCWTLQPDGRYFEDEDGFGTENCEEICLHSYIDEQGRFTEVFHE